MTTDMNVRDDRTQKNASSKAEEANPVAATAWAAPSSVAVRDLVNSGKGEAARISVSLVARQGIGLSRCVSGY